MKRNTNEQSTVPQISCVAPPVKRVLFLAMLLIVAGAAFADATVSHGVRIEIQPIKLLEVKNNWETHTLAPTRSGGTAATASTSYGVTCIVENAMIGATLTAPLPEGAVVKLRMRTTIGTSLGWVELREGMPANLVSGPRGAEYNVVEMEFTVHAGVAVNSAPISIVFGIN